MISKEDKTEFNELIELLDTKYNYPYVDMLKRVKQYINTPIPLDSEVEKAIKGLESMADWYVDANDYRDKFAQERLEKYINTIRQALQDKDRQFEKCFKISYSRKNEIRKLTSQLNQVKELNNINETIILMLHFPHNPHFKKEFERLGGGKRKQQILGDDTNE